MRRPLPRVWLVIALALAPAAAQGYRGLARCPDLEPRSPRRVTEPAALDCQDGLATAGRIFLRKLLAAQGVCLDRALAGEFPPVPERTHPLRVDDAVRDACLGLRLLSSGEYRMPEDPDTAAAVEEAFAASEATAAERCRDEDLARLDAGGDTLAGALASLWADHWDHAQHLLEQAYGQVREVEDPGARACQAALGRAGARLVLAQQRAVSHCLTSHRARSRWVRDRARLCVGAVRHGRTLPPLDRATAVRLFLAELGFARQVRRHCADEQLAVLDACGADRASLQRCMRCSNRREAMYLVDAAFGGEARHATTHFIDWAALHNPVIGLEDRRLKDQVLGYRHGEFFFYASQSFRDDDPERDTKPRLAFRTRDFRHYDTFPESVVAGGSVGSPDLARFDGVWHMVFQDPDPLDPESRRLFLATSHDLVDWSSPFEVSRDLLPGTSIIDGALARRGGYWWLVFKNRETNEPFFSRSAGAQLNQDWLPARRFVAGGEEIFLGLGDGFAENFQLIEIDGQLRLLATAREREGLRCFNLYTCWHEPHLYSLDAGDGTRLEDWERWGHKTWLRIPYEDWNPVMHANTGYLDDFRSRDGFFYLSYSGSVDSESFQGRGHGMLGLARSRDLVHWRVAGDLRD
jgi:hypothetical protein